MVRMKRPLFRRMFVFAVRERSRMKTHSGLFLPNSSRGSLTRAEDIWVLAPANDCRSVWTKGQHLLISDGFELEPVQLDFWEEHQNDPEFASLKKYAEDVGGKVICTITNEDSILGEVEGELFQEDCAW